MPSSSAMASNARVRQRDLNRSVEELSPFCKPQIVAQTVANSPGDIWGYSGGAPAPTNLKNSSTLTGYALDGYDNRCLNGLSSSESGPWRLVSRHFPGLARSYQ